MRPSPLAPICAEKSVLSQTLMPKWSVRSRVFVGRQIPPGAGRFLPGEHA